MSLLTFEQVTPLPALFRIAGLTFPFTQQGVEEAVQFVLDQSIKNK